MRTKRNSLVAHIRRPRFDGIPFIGREAQLSDLKDIYSCVRGEKDEPVIVDIGGFSGVGKSTLVRRLAQFIVNDNDNDDDDQPCHRRKSFFALGKYERLGSSRPYAAIAAALEAFVSQVPYDISDLQKSLEDHLDDDQAQLLMAIFPCLSAWFRSIRSDRKQETVETLGKHRLKVAFRDLFRAICNCVQHLVFALDDMHWADEESLEVMSGLATDKEIKGLILIMTFRSNEVSVDHPFHKFLLKAEEKGCTRHSLSIDNLTPNELNQVVAHILEYPETSETLELTAVVYRKTEGNVFYSIQLLRSLVKKHAIFFSMKEFKFVWNMDVVNAEATLSDNVVGLVSAKLKALPLVDQHAMMLGSCLGTRFRKSLVEQLIMIEQDHSSRSACSSSSTDTTASFETLVSEGLLNQGDDDSTFIFSHDRIQQAAYGLFECQEDTERTHLRIGRHLCFDKDDDELSENSTLLLVAHQMNMGSKWINKDEELLKLARFNLGAAKLAKSKSAFEQGVEFSRTGLKLLSKDSMWTNQYRIALQLHVVLAEMLYVLGRYEDLDETMAHIFRQARKFEDSRSTVLVKMNSLISRDHLSEAIEYAIQVSAERGFRIPRRPNKFQILLEFLRVKRKLRKFSDKNLLELGEMDDADEVFAMSLLTRLTSACYSKNEPLITFISMLRSLRISLKFGACRYTSVALTWYAILLGSVGDVEESYNIGMLARGLAERFNSKEVNGIFWNTYLTTIHSIRRPIQDLLDPFLETFDRAFEMGDVIQAATSAQLYVTSYAQSGLPLEPIINDGRNFAAQFEKSGQRNIRGVLDIWCQFVLNLTGNAADPFKLDGEAFAKDSLELYVEEGNELVIFSYYAAAFMLFGMLEPGRKETRDTFEKLLRLDVETVTGTINFMLPSFAFSNAVTAIWYDRKTRGQRRYRRIWTRYLHMLEKWERRGIPNLSHKIMLLKAERMTLSKKEKGLVATIKEQYDDAIKTAARSGYLQDCATANERCGDFFISAGDQGWAEHYLKRAVELYDEWGATAKVDLMLAKYPLLLSDLEISGVFQRQFLDLSSQSRVGGTFKARERFKEDAKELYSVSINELVHPNEVN